MIFCPLGLDILLPDGKKSAHALISDIGIERRKANADHYARFEAEGSLTKFNYMPPETEHVALPLNIQYVVDLVTKVQVLGKLAQVGVDAAGIGSIVDALGEIGVTQDAATLDAVRQGIALMGAIKTLEIKLADYSFRHGNSELLKWCVGNLIVVPTPTAMRVARDDSGYGKVDPFMALANAAHLMCLNPEPKSAAKFQLFFCMNEVTIVRLEITPELAAFLRDECEYYLDGNKRNCDTLRLMGLSGLDPIPPGIEEDPELLKVFMSTKLFWDMVCSAKTITIDSSEPLAATRMSAMKRSRAPSAPVNASSHSPVFAPGVAGRALMEATLPYKKVANRRIQIGLRLPKDMHEFIVRESRKYSRTKNGQIVYMLTEAKFIIKWGLDDKIYGIRSKLSDRPDDPN